MRQSRYCVYTRPLHDIQNHNRQLKEPLENIFDFLDKNRIYNKQFQTRYYSSILNAHNKKSDKIISLLYKTANTQSRPKIDNLSEFYKKIHQDIELIESFSGFLSIIKTDGLETINYKGLFDGLKKQRGWGDKTSALFTKVIYHLHNNDYPKELRIWNDAPKRLENNDKFYLPVDAVIIAIFKQIKDTNWDFKKINHIIGKYYEGEKVEVWDDLWFWGFITQIGTGNSRKMAWNLNKYWSLRESDKNPKKILEIQEKSEQFLNILLESTSCNNV